MKQVRYRIFLPMLMVSVSLTLMVITARQEAERARDWGMGFQVPARTANMIVNGPAFAFAPYLPGMSSRWLGWEGHRLVTIGLFWLCIGYALDRRSRPRFHESSPRVARGFFGLALLASAVLTLMVSIGIYNNVNYPFYWKRLAEGNVLFWENLFSMFWVARVALAAWLFYATIYFGKKACEAWRFSGKP